MITIRNTQRKIPINVATLKKNAHRILRALGYDDFDLGIWLTTNKTIQQYNRIYRKKDRPTDILSFSFHPTLKPGQTIQPKTEDEKNLGDLIIAPEFVQMAARELRVSLQKRLEVLLVHGICHLLGYDHIKDSDYKVMQKKEDALLKVLKK